MASSKSTKKTTSKKPNTSKKPQTKKHQEEPQKTGINPQIKAILLCACSVLFFALLLIEGDNVWLAVRSFIFGVFGFCFALIPFVFLYLGIMTAKEKQMSHKGAKVALSVLILLFVCTLFYLCAKIDYNENTYLEALSQSYLNSSQHISMCGLLGCVLGYPFRLWFTNAPAIIITVLVIIVLVMLLTGITLVDVANVAKKRYEKHREHKRERIVQKEEEAETSVTDDTKYYAGSKKATDNYSIDIPLEKEKKKKRAKTKEDIEDQQIIDIINNANHGIMSDDELDATEVAKRISKQKNTKSYAEGAKQADPQTVPIDVDIDSETTRFEKEVKTAKAEKKPKYSYPPVKLLDPAVDSEGASAMNEMQNNATKLVETLKSFGVSASITNICRGPSVTRYELQPAAGVKISKITNLSDDIALNLAANGVRIEAPIPGKAAVGIEVPNKVISTVSLRELIDSDEFKNNKSNLACVLGKDISGNIVITDLSKMPHLLIAGTTGSGKSVCVNSLLMSILFKSSPDEVKLLLIDPKLVEFSKYKGIPHLLVPVVSDAKKAAGALNWAVSEMLNRYKTFSEYDCKDINSFNALVKRNLEYIEENTNDSMTDEEKEAVCLEVEGLKVPKEYMCRTVIAIDELADLMMAAPAEVEEAICRLAQMARAAGMHLIIATQRPSVNVITGVIKANIPSRIALKVSSNVDSRTILDNGGAEKLIGNGDMLYSPVGANKPLRVQGCFAKDEEIERVTTYIKEKHRAQYNEEVEQKIRKIASEELSGKTKDNEKSQNAPEVDSLMEEAIKVVIEAGQASTSLLQRRLKVGYARAGRMIDDMEQMGIVGPHQGSKARDVLMTYNEWLERNNMLGSVDDSDIDDVEDEE
ncbi:MAG: DNA translocase FtsK 4TM domain-containing protein [Oscillospiraceae bacterium]|nr:DNA translocase FtsK 4TM domain-containing protein [Candidatus Ruminococcus equi]